MSIKAINATQKQIKAAFKTVGKEFGISKTDVKKAEMFFDVIMSDSDQFTKAGYPSRKGRAIMAKALENGKLPSYLTIKDQVRILFSKLCEKPSEKAQRSIALLEKRLKR